MHVLTFTLTNLIVFNQILCYFKCQNKDNDWNNGDLIELFCLFYFFYLHPYPTLICIIFFHLLNFPIKGAEKSTEELLPFYFVTRLNTID
jgi:hypothetical protein